MDQELLQAIQDAVKSSVRETVNGKIARLDEKLDAHIAKVEPYLQGVAGLGFIWKTAVAIGGAVLIYIQIKQSFFGN